MTDEETITNIIKLAENGGYKQKHIKFDSTKKWKVIYRTSEGDYLFEISDRFDRVVWIFDIEKILFDYDFAKALKHKPYLMELAKAKDRMNYLRKFLRKSIDNI